MTKPLFEMLGMAPWIESRTPMRRLGDPEQDLRGPLLFLASEASSYVSGHSLMVDGAFDASRGAWQIAPATSRGTRTSRRQARRTQVWCRTRSTSGRWASPESTTRCRRPDPR
jgi:hypothetical protein